MRRRAEGQAPRRSPYPVSRTALGWLNRIVPKDRGGRCLARGIPFGPKARHRLDLYGPSAPAASPRPVMVFFYGGGWNSGTREDYEFAGRTFAALGFLTAIPDYGIVPAARYPVFLEDCARAAAWTLRHAPEYGGDPGRLLLSGQSAGAYNAVMLGLAPDRFGAPGLPRVLRGVVGLSGPYDFFPFDVRESIEAFAHAPEPAVTQPVNLVHSGAPPMFLAHGTRDRTVHLRNTAALAARLRQADVPVVERHYRFGHAASALDLMRPLRWTSPMFSDMARFLAMVSERGDAAGRGPGSLSDPSRWVDPPAWGAGRRG